MTGDADGDDAGPSAGERAAPSWLADPVATDAGFGDETSRETEPEATAGSWPVDLRGVTETVVATLGPNGLWNFAALGVHAPGSSTWSGTAPSAETTADHASDPARARTWGNTRTRRNFHRQGEGVVQFVSDPRAFVESAMTIYEAERPVLPSADAWVRVTVESTGAAERGETSTEDWMLAPKEGAVRRRRPCTINRAFAAVVDATVAASRLDVPGYDTEELRSRLRYFAETVERCGGPAEREAFARIDEIAAWRAE